MNITKAIILTIAGIVAIAIILLTIQLLLRKLRSKSEIDSKLKLSYGIWFVTLFIAAMIINSKVILVLSDAVDNIYKMNTANLLIESVETSSLFIGIGIVWFFVWFYIANFLSVIVVGKRIDSNEMETDNYSYFLIKGLLVIGFALCLLPIFEMLLRVFIPNVQLPFYH